MPKGRTFSIHMDHIWQVRLETWIASQPAGPSLSHAFRYFFEKGVKAYAPELMNIPERPDERQTVMDFNDNQEKTING